MQDDPGEAVMTVLAMASAMVRTYREDTLGAARRHITRCLEENLIEDVEFWLRVRNQVELLQWEKTSGGRDRKRAPAAHGRPGEEVVLEAWLKDVLSRMAASVLDEPIPEALLRLIGPPVPERDPG